MDTASARYIEHQEVWGYCIQGQWFQECNWILFKGRCISPHVSYVVPKKEILESID
jgi:hypothetical protein